MDVLQDNSTIEIYDLMGKKIYESSLTQKTTQLDLSHQPKGVYLLKVLSEERPFTERIVIQ